MVKHLALIMDGNRRWARKRAFMPWLGHKEGVKAVRNSIMFCLDQKISFLTLYTFSLENFKRSNQELSYLFALMLEQIKEQADELIQNNVCIKFIGDKSVFPNSILPAVEELENLTKNYNVLTVYVLFCYGGQQEIANTVRKIAQDVASGKINPSDINNIKIEEYLWIPAKPAPDLVIRTGGAQRLSNFLSYQAAYSELYFTNTLWPDITKEDLQEALDVYQNRKRNFGA